VRVSMHVKTKDQVIVVAGADKGKVTTVVEVGRALQPAPGFAHSVSVYPRTLAASSSPASHGPSPPARCLAHAARAAQDGVPLCWWCIALTSLTMISATP